MDYDQMARDAILEGDIEKFKEALFHRSYSLNLDYQSPLQYKEAIDTILQLEPEIRDQFLSFLEDLYNFMKPYWVHRGLFYFQVGEDLNPMSYETLCENSYFRYRNYPAFQSFKPRDV